MPKQMHESISPSNPTQCRLSSMSPWRVGDNGVVFVGFTTIIATGAAIKNRRYPVDLKDKYCMAWFWLFIPASAGHRPGETTKQSNPVAQPALCSEIYRPPTSTIAHYECAFDFRTRCTTCVLGALLPGMLSDPELAGRRPGDGARHATGDM
ncbi:hypothetical protein ACTOWA_03075 [Herbaspirillum seropedicae]|uniref:hypothetical protein n=1 Tax=Herbaspirillum seropedicae TaxID=964 RepID=UPI003F8D3277